MSKEDKQTLKEYQISLISIIFKKIKKKTTNINEVDAKKLVSSNKTPYGREGANKYYIGCVGSIGFKPLHIIIKKIKLYTNHMKYHMNY